MSPLRMMYLALTVWGAIHPMRYFLEWFPEKSEHNIPERGQITLRDNHELRLPHMTEADVKGLALKLMGGEA